MQTILRAEPFLFGLYRLVALWFSELPRTNAEIQLSPGREESDRH